MHNFGTQRWAFSKNLAAVSLEDLLFDGFEEAPALCLLLGQDDMELAPDFFSYFAALAPVLEQDPSLMCVSSWNDHGQEQFVRDTHALYRSDFFPGLGWMLQRSLWEELRYVRGLVLTT